MSDKKNTAGKNNFLIKISNKLKLRDTWQLHLMIFAPLVMIIIFEYIPIAGLSISFQQFLPGRGFFGSKWVGLKHFKYLTMLPDTWRVIRNTLIISFAKIFLTLGLALVIALLINEMRFKRLGKLVQTVSLFPYYLSWVVLGGIVIDIFSYNGIFNDLLEQITGNRQTFMISNEYMRTIIIGTHIWKEVGYNVIILMAAISAIDETMYEAGDLDGTSRFQRIWYLTLPNILPMVSILLVLAMGNLMSAGFDQVFVLYSSPVYETTDILDTYIYRMGILNGQYSIASAVGLFKSVVGMFLVLSSSWIAKKFSGYRIF